MLGRLREARRRVRIRGGRCANQFGKSPIVPFEWDGMQFADSTETILAPFSRTLPARAPQPDLSGAWAAGRDQPVERHRVAQEDRPDKKVYTITDAGGAALNAWGTSAPAPSSGRDDLVLRACSLWLADPDQAIALFRPAEQRHAEQLAAYRAEADSMEREHPSSGAGGCRTARPAYRGLDSVLRRSPD